MNIWISGELPLSLSFPVGQSLRGRAPEPSMRSEPTEAMGVHILSHTVNR